MGCEPPVVSMITSPKIRLESTLTEATWSIPIVSSKWPKSRGVYRTTRFGNTATCVGQTRLPFVQRDARKTGTSFVKGRLRPRLTAQERSPRPSTAAMVRVMGSIRAGSGLLGHDEAALLAFVGGIREAVVEGEGPRAVRGQVDDARASGRHALLHAERVEGEAVLAVGGRERDADRLTLAGGNAVGAEPSSGDRDLDAIDGSREAGGEPGSRQGRQEQRKRPRPREAPDPPPRPGHGQRGRPPRACSRRWSSRCPPPRCSRRSPPWGRWSESVPEPPSPGAPPCACSSRALRDRRILPEGSMLTTFTRIWSPSFTSLRTSFTR